MIAYRLPRKHQGRTYASRRCRSRCDGRCDCSPAHGSRAPGDRVESFARKDQAIGRSGREGGGDAGRSCECSRDDHHDADRRSGDRRGLQRTERAARRRCERQAVHRDEYCASEGTDRARTQGAREGRGVCRVSGRRVDSAGTAGKAARSDGRRSLPMRNAPNRSSISSAGDSSIAARSAPVPR